MIKKLVSLLCGLAPMVAIGADLPTYTGSGCVKIMLPDGINYYYSCDPALISAEGVGSDSGLDSINVPETVVVKTGKGITVGTGGINLAGNMYVGQDWLGSTTGQLYIEAATNPIFTIVSDGAVSVAGSLNVYNGRTLALSGGATAVNASFGSISNLGVLNISNIATLTSGQITTSNNMSLSAAAMNLGAVANNNGNTTINSTGNLTMTQFVGNSTGTSTITAGSINSGSIQNNSGTTNITTTTGLTSTGSIENSGTMMNIAGGAVNALTMKNDSNASTMVMNVAGLRLTGGDALNASFVNGGNLSMTVAGDTYLAYGFDLSTMDITNEFSLETGTLTIVNNVDSWLQLFSNRLNKFEVIVNNGAIDETNGVINIVNGSGGNTANATMNLKAKTIDVTSILNAGKQLNMTSTDTAGGIFVSSNVSNNAGSTTVLTSAGKLNVTGGVSNDGTLTLNGNDVNLNSVANEGTLEISSLTDASGIIKVTNGVTNTSATTYINARQIDIDGALVNYGGTTTLRGSDSNGGGIAIGSIDAEGGVINLDSLVGDIAVDNTVYVNGGSLNFGSNTKSITAGDSININGNVTASSTAATGAGNVNIANSGNQNFVMKSTGGNITIGGNVSAIANDVARTVLFDSTVIDITGNVTAGNQGRLTFGDTLATHLNIGGNLISNAGGIIDLNVGETKAGTISGAGKFIARGQIIEATAAANDAINIQNGIWFDGSNPTSGMIVTGTNDLTLVTSGSGADISVAGGIAIGSGNKLTLNSADNINTAGNVAIANGAELDVNATSSAAFTNAINNAGTLTVDGASITANGITNTGTATLTTTGALSTGSITNSGALTATANTIAATAINGTAGSMDFTANSLTMTLLNLTGGYANLNANSITATGNISATGDLVQGGTTGMLNLTKNNTTLAANNLTVGGNFIAGQYNAIYNIQNALKVTGDMTVANGAKTDVAADSISIDDVTNSGTLLLSADSVDLGDVINSGILEINSGATNLMTVDSFTTNANSSTKLIGTGMTSVGDIELAGRLLQNATGTVGNGDVNVISSNYVMTGDSITTTGINQTSGKMTLNTSDLDVNGSILAKDLRVAAQGADWLTVDVTGSVSGGVDFIGLERMTVGGNYIFDDNSIIMAAILDRGVTSHNYWSTVSLNDDNTLGQITNGTNAEPLISINGKFISQMDLNNPNMYYDWNNGTAGEIKDGQMGVYITDIVDQGTAIWLIHADGGIEDDGKKLRNAVVRFCNADGSMCYNYLDSVGNGSTDEDELPIYLSLRDSDGDGEPDSWYLVFDPRFGGPVELFKIQPIVDREDDHTDGEYWTAGALDDLLEGRLNQTGFYNRTPIELVPVIFENTNLETMAKELYDRMEQYVLDRNGEGLARFSRLFQPREIEQIAGNVALNEHTTFRDFEDHMFDEFIWNRHRSLKKGWLDVDFGMWNQKVQDGKRADGERFSIQGGFDWQDSETLIMGLAAHASHTTGSSDDAMDLGYKPGQSIAGHVDLDVATTNIGLGGYLMKTLGTKARLYGNAFLDLHLFDITRDQNFVDTIDGSGTSFSIITEWGLLHDWLNQYIVGNVYVRAGYNFGFSVTEKAAGADYMKLESDGYLILTPGYSLTAQKRIYTSPWFQMRPYLSVGVEYDVLGVPDTAQFKFAYANKFTDYDINIDPLWVNGGGGVEFLHASGWQFGMDYRYQYNADIQMHKVKLSGSYRF